MISKIKKMKNNTQVDFMSKINEIIDTVNILIEQKNKEKKYLETVSKISPGNIIIDSKVIKTLEDYNNAVKSSTEKTYPLKQRTKLSCPKCGNMLLNLDYSKRIKYREPIKVKCSDCEYVGTAVLD